MPAVKDASWVVQLWEAGGWQAVLLAGSLALLGLTLYVYMRVQTARAAKAPAPALTPPPEPPKRPPGPRTQITTASITHLLEQVADLTKSVETIKHLGQTTETLRRAIEEQSGSCTEHRAAYDRDLASIQGQVEGVGREVDDLATHVRETLGQLQQNILQLAMRRGD